LAILHGLRYAAVQHVGRSGDQGVDIIATDSSGTQWVVQCNRSRNPIGVEPVRLLAQARTRHRGCHAMLVTNSRLTSGARREAGEYRITVIDRRRLANCLSQMNVRAPERRAGQG
jgi:restriction system protein